jgi:hypothetical protein
MERAKQQMAKRPRAIRRIDKVPRAKWRRAKGRRAKGRRDKGPR